MQRQMQIGNSFRINSHVLYWCAPLHVVFGLPASWFAKALAIYRIENPRNPENRRKIGKISENPIFCLFWVYFSDIFAYFSPIFWISGVFYSVDGQGFCNSWLNPQKRSCVFLT